MKLSICSLLVSSLSHLPRYGRAAWLSYTSPRNWAVQCLVILIALAACPRPLMAQCEEDQILPFDGMPGDGFGKSVAMDGNVAIIGTASIDEIPRPGSAYIYRFDGVNWNPEAKFQPEGVGDSDSFASVVSIHGDVAVVGSHLDDDLGDDSGSVYVFRFNGDEWIEDGHLFSPTGVAGDNFGAAVDIHGDYIAIGAPGQSDFFSRAGASYIFRHDGQHWNYHQFLPAPEFIAGLQYGITLAIDEQHLAVGSRQLSRNDTKGKVWTFLLTHDIWLPTGYLQPEDIYRNARFGSKIDIDGNTMAIVSPILRAIFFYYFDNHSWVEQQTVEQPRSSRGVNSISNLSLKGDLLVTEGFHNVDDDEPFNAFALLYRYDITRSPEAPWFFDRVLLPSNPLAATTDVVATNGDIILAGNQDNFLDDTRAGTVYVFPGVTEHSDCNDNYVSDACEIFSGLSMDCNSNVIPDECELDCDGNGIPDECEIAAGTAIDGNNNGLLDECECPARFPVHPDDPDDELKFTYSLDISKDVAIVGTPDSHGNELYSGVAIIYRRINGIWTQEARLVASDGQIDDEFGYEVGIDGNTAVVCKNFWRGDYDGAVYIFQYQEDSGQWVEKQIIPNPEHIAKFGIDVAISGNRFVVLHGWGAGFNGTVVSIYKYNENDDAWEFEDRFQVAPSSTAWFPQSNLELNGDLLIGGMAGPFDQSRSTITIHRRHDEPDGTSRWQMEAKLTSPDSEVFDFYGLSCAIDGDIAVVGALWNVNNKIKTGAAYVYEYDGASWEYTKKLLPDNLDRERDFGSTTAVKRGIIMIGAQRDARHGSLYRFQRIRNADLTTSWEPITKVHFYDTERVEYVGRKMEADGEFAIIGSLIRRPPSFDSHSGIHIVEGIQDTDRDGFSDLCDTCPDTPNLDLSDTDGDGLGDACDVFGDVNNDGLINVSDLLQMLAAWGYCPDNGLPCLADLDRDGSINVTDLLLLILAW